jgi:hypothetical protein
MLTTPSTSRITFTSNIASRCKLRNRHWPRKRAPVRAQRRPRNLRLRLRRFQPRDTQARAQQPVSVDRDPHPTIRCCGRSFGTKGLPGSSRHLRPSRCLLRQRGNIIRQGVLGRVGRRFHERVAHKRSLRFSRCETRISRYAQDVGSETIPERQHHRHGECSRSPIQRRSYGLLRFKGRSDQSDADVRVSACWLGYKM